MASSGHQHKSTRKFAEGSAKTAVGLHKTEVQLKKMIDTLEQQQNTAVNNIANHQQAMKMSWRRLEEKRASSPQVRRNDKKEDTKKARTGMMLQSNTKLYVNKTPEIYNVGPQAARPTTADDSVLGRTTPATDSQGYYIKTKQKQGPPPTQITRSYTSPYISSPMGFRKHQEPQERRKGSDVQLNSDSSQEFLSSSSQPMLIKKSSINDKETLLKASNFMGMQSSSAGPGGFKNFYSERPRSLRERALSPLVSQQAQQLEEMLSMDEKDENSDEVFEDEVSASNSMPTLAEQFEQIKSCKYIRHSKHYHPERAALEEY